jgi:hypothetical protein
VGFRKAKDMTKNLKVGILLIIPTILAPVASMIAQRIQSENKIPASRPSISVTITPTMEAIKSGSPVVLNVVLKNVAYHTINYTWTNGDDRGGWDYHVDVWDEKLAEP